MHITTSDPQGTRIHTQKKIKGNGKFITKSITISDFSKIEISTAVEINYSQTPNTGFLEFTIDENLWEYYDIYTKDSVLYIKVTIDEYLKNGVYLRIMPKKSVITVSSEQLEQMNITGRSNINFCTPFISKLLNVRIRGSGNLMANKHPVQIENFNIAVGGSGSARLAGNIQQANIQIRGSGGVIFAGAIQQTVVQIGGSGNVQLSGTIQQANMQIRGSGSVKALESKIAQLQVEVAGSGNVEVHVTDHLDINLRGSGSVRFKGDPHPLTTNLRGSGKIKKL
jgi:hypothetical protein